MDNQTLNQMLRVLQPAIKDPAKAQKLLEKFWQDKMALVWTTEHIHKAANEKDTVLTEEEARQVLKQLHQNHNYQYGIRWSDLGEVIHDNGLGRKITQAELTRFLRDDILAIQPSTKPKKGIK